MKRKPMRRTRLGLAILLSLTLPAFPAHAEWFGDIAIGTAFTHSSDVDSTPAGGPQTTFPDVGYDKSFTIGGRVGYWLEPVRPFPLHFGLAANLFRFSPEITSQTNPAGVLNGFTQIDVTAVALDLMVRFPMLVNTNYPIGRLRPYATLGPALFWSTIKDAGNFGAASATDASLGLKFGMGVAYAIRPNVDLFGEYRYTHFSIDSKGVATGGTDRLQMDINTSHLLVGLGFRF